MSDSLHVFNNPYSELNLQTTIKKYQLYNVFMLAPAILCILKGPDHILELANEPFRQLIGNRNPIGQTLKEALPEIEGQGYFEILDKVYKTGEPFSGKEMPVYINRNDNRELVYLNLNYQVFLNDNETIEGILVFAYDVTEQVNSRHKVQENESKYRDLIHGLPTALYTCDKEGYIQLYNAAAVKLWGRKPEIGKDLWCGSWEIYKTDGSPLGLDECPMAIALKEGRISNMEIVIKRPDGTKRNVIPHPQPLFDLEGKITGAINTLIDITERVEAQRKMEQVAQMVENLYMNAPAFICTLKGPEYVFELVNPKYQRLYGKRRLLGTKN